MICLTITKKAVANRWVFPRLRTSLSQFPLAESVVLFQAKPPGTKFASYLLQTDPYAVVISQYHVLGIRYRRLRCTSCIKHYLRSTRCFSNRTRADQKKVAQQSRIVWASFSTANDIRIHELIPSTFERLTSSISIQPCSAGTASIAASRYREKSEQVYGPLALCF